MLDIGDKILSDNEHKAIEAFKERIVNRFKFAEVVLFGSKARGNYDNDSDIDILVLLNEESNTSIEEEIFDIGFDIEIKYDVILGILVHSKVFWNSKGSLMPIHQEIKRDGIQI
jgi:uncharacterized protein